MLRCFQIYRFLILGATLGLCCNLSSDFGYAQPAVNGGMPVPDPVAAPPPLVPAANLTLPVSATAQVCCRMDTTDKKTLNTGCPYAPNEICIGMIPFCKDLWAPVPEPQDAGPGKLQYSVRQSLSQKLYDLYHLKDSPLLLPTTTVPTTGPVMTFTADDFPHPVCSPVGNRVALQSQHLENPPAGFTKISAALANSVMGLGLPSAVPPPYPLTIEQNQFGFSCGAHPKLTTDANNPIPLTLDFASNASGQLWGAHVLGAYSWAIRAEAYHFLKAVDPNLNDLPYQLGDQGQLAVDHNQHYLELKSYYQQMSPIEQATCEAPENLKSESELALDEYPFCPEDPSITSPAIRLCTQAKWAKLFAKNGLHYLILKRILERAQQVQDFFFGTFFDANQDTATDPSASSDLAQLSGRNADDFSKNGNILLHELMNDCENFAWDMSQPFPPEAETLKQVRPSCFAACLFGGPYKRDPVTSSVVRGLPESTTGLVPEANRCSVWVRPKLSAYLNGTYKTRFDDVANTRYSGSGQSILSTANLPATWWAMSPTGPASTSSVQPTPTPFASAFNSGGVANVIIPNPPDFGTPQTINWFQSSFWKHRVPYDPQYDRSVTFSVLPGALGIIERIVRVNYCGQLHVADANNVCDKIQIPVDSVLGAVTNP
jgi:hypothetical protein